MEEISQLAANSEGLLIPTSRTIVDVTEPTSEKEATHLWEELTGRGGEGMVKFSYPSRLRIFTEAQCEFCANTPRG